MTASSKKTAAKKTATVRRADKLRMVAFIKEAFECPTRLYEVPAHVHGGRECIELSTPTYDVEIYAWDGEFYEDDVGTLGAPTSKFCPVYVAVYSKNTGEFDHGKFFNTLANWVYFRKPRFVVWSER